MRINFVVIQQDDGWYFQYRSDKLHGPFKSEFEADLEGRKYNDRMTVWGRGVPESSIVNYKLNTEGYDNNELLKRSRERRRFCSPFGTDG